MLKKISLLSSFRLLSFKTKRFYETLQLNLIGKEDLQELNNFFNNNDSKVNLITATYEFKPSHFSFKQENEIFFIDKSRKFSFYFL